MKIGDTVRYKRGFSNEDGSLFFVVAINQAYPSEGFAHPQVVLANTMNGAWRRLENNSQFLEVAV